ncbi:MAG: HAF repeat-containing protein, partial [Janthinobacterium sp.]
MRFHASLLGLLLLAAVPTASAAIYAERGFGERDGNGSIASDLNPAGLVAGIIMEDEGRRRAVTYQHGRIRELGTLGGASSYASGLNNHGVVVGTAQRGDGYRRAFVYRPGAGMQEIGTLPGG